MRKHQQSIRLVPRLRRYVRALFRLRAAADQEVVFETLERAGQELHVYSLERASWARLFALAHAVYLEKLHAPGSQPRKGVTMQRDFEALVARLPPEQRQVFVLVTLEEMSYANVAKTLGMPIGTVMSRLFRARANLRSLLGVPSTGNPARGQISQG